jgi:hypothetical protein
VDYFKGIKIRFYRRPISYVDNNNFTIGDFLIWGYYDWAKIELGTFSLDDYYNNNSGTSSIIHNYEEQALFGYYLSDQDQLRDIINLDNSTYPLIVVTEIKLINAKEKPQTNDLQSFLTKKIENNFFEFNIFYSLGHSDYIIIFRAKSYYPILEILQELKINYGENIDSVYSLHGIHKNSMSNWQDPKCMRLSIFMSLKNSLHTIDLKNAIRKYLSPPENSELFSSVSTNAFPIFGKYDVEIIIDNIKDTRNVLKLLDRGQQAIFSSNNLFFQKNINYTRTRWFYDQQNETILLSRNNKKRNPENEIIRQDISNLIKEIKPIPQTIICHALMTSLLELCNRYNQIALNQVASPELTEQIGKIILSFLKLILNDAGIAAKKNGSLSSIPNYDQLKTVQADSLERGIFQISELLQDWGKLIEQYWKDLFIVFITLMHQQKFIYVITALLK